MADTVFFKKEEGYSEDCCDGLEEGGGKIGPLGVARFYLRGLSAPATTGGGYENGS